MQKRPLSLFCLLFLLIMTAVGLALPPPSIVEEALAGKQISITGNVSKIEDGEKSYQIYLSNVTFRNGVSLTNNQMILCKMKTKERIRLGSKVTFRGKVTFFSCARNPGEMNFAKYYKEQEIAFCLEEVEVQEVGTQYQLFEEFFYQLRIAISGHLDTLFPAKEAGVLKAMLVGEKSRVEKEVKEIYQRAGLSHLLAISGMHITLFAIALLKVCEFRTLPRTVSILLPSVGLLFYANILNISASSFRAVFMFFLQMGARYTKRTYDVLTALSFGAAMFLITSFRATFLPAFQLSFLAVLGLSVVYPKLCQWDLPEGILGKLVKSLLAGISVNVLLLPILLWRQSSFPPYSLFLNLIAVPLLPFILFFACLAMIVGLIWLPLGIVIGKPAIWLLALIEGMGAFSLRLPGSEWVVGRPQVWKIILYMILLLAGIFPWKRKRKRKLVLFWCVALCVLGIRFEGRLQITMLDVGQGDGIFIKSPTGVTYFMDGGSSDKKNLATYQIEPFLRYFAVKELDFVFLSHMDQDHTQGIIEMLGKQAQGVARVRIKNLILPRIAIQEEEVRELLELCKAAKVEVSYMQTGDRKSDGLVTFTCIYPDERKEIGGYESNERSMVLSLSYDKFDMLFTGDLEGRGEDIMLSNLKKLPEQIVFDVLKVAHHGAKNANSKKLLKEINPKLGLISCGVSNRYGHPHPEVLNRLEEAGISWIATADTGAITLWVSKRGIEIEKFLN